MAAIRQDEQTRRRAPSRRSLATKARILDAAETVFAQKGYDGATIRDVAAAAGERVSLVHHHGGGKEELFRKTVARRAADLAAARHAALARAKADAAPTVDAILRAFLGPLLTLAADEARWRAYARLVAHVSADERWRDLAADHFDPTAEVFIDELAHAAPGAGRIAVAAGFVFTVSAMLSVLAADWRIAALGGDQGQGAQTDWLDHLTIFCAAGFQATASAEASGP